MRFSRGSRSLFREAQRLESCDPHRRMPNGEMVWESRKRLLSYDKELRLQAMSQVSKLVRHGGWLEIDAEDEVYGKRFGLDRFPLRGVQESSDRRTLEQVLKERG